MRLPAGGLCKRSYGTPPGARSMSIAADCFVPERTAKKRLPLCPAFLSFGWLLDGAADRAAVRFFALIIIGISLGSIAARLLLHHRSPAEALTPAGRDPGATKARRKQAQ
jgi:hypothetical protein